MKIFEVYEAGKTQARQGSFAGRETHTIKYAGCCVARGGFIY